MKTQTRVNQKKNKQRKSRMLWLAGAAAGLVVLAGAAGTFVYKFNTSDATIAQGNQAFAAQEYDAALAKYQSAQASAPIFAEPFYNAANVLYKQTKFQEAQPLLQEALARSNDKIGEFIRFNLGNIAFNAQQFDQAIEQYQDALRLNPTDKDAKYNLELALLQQQQQQQQQQEQNKDQQNQDQQNQDQQNQDQQNQDQQNQDQQNQDKQNQDQQNQDQQNQDQQNQDQQNRDQQNQDQKNQDQQNQNQQNQDQKDQQGQDQKDQQGQQGQDQKDRQGQQGQDQKDQQGQQGQDQKDQQGQQGQDQKDQQGQNQQQGNGGQGEQTDEQGQEKGYTYVPGELTKDQAEQILAAVGGNSQTLMEKLQQYLYVPGGTPEKDW